MSEERVSVAVEGRTLTLSNMAKELYPAAGFPKPAVIDYYARIAPVLLPHLADRALTVKRYPNGVDAPFFYEKNAPRGTPDWVRRVTLPAPGSTKNRDTIDYLVVEEAATLIWLANLAALELHTPQWRVADGDGPRTDLLVFDLDPGEGAGIAECCTVALLLREIVEADGLAPAAKTSGSKGVQVSAPVVADDPGLPSRYAHALARRLEAEHPALVVSRMTRALRPGKVLVDWSQNNPAKTTVAPYSLRAKDAPTVSTPLRWDEVEAGAAGRAALRFTADDVLGRVAEAGDLFAGVLDDRRRAEITRAAATAQ